MIFKSACCTSPETSRVIEGLSTPGNFVDFVNVDDAPLGALDVVFRRLQKLQDDVLDIFAHIAGLVSVVASAIVNVSNSRKRLSQKRLAAARWPDQHGAGFRQLDPLTLTRDSGAYSGCAPPRRVPACRLTDHVIAKNLANLFRGRHTIRGFQTAVFVFPG